MQNASNEKRKVSTNYLSGNHRLSVRVHPTATPVQAVHVRTERTIVNEPAKRRCVSLAPRKQLHFQEQSTTAETTKSMSPLQAFLQEKRKAVDNQRRRVSQLRANSRGADETHRRFACSFTIVLSVLINIYSLNWSGSSMHSN